MSRLSTLPTRPRRALLPRVGAVAVAAGAIVATAVAPASAHATVTASTTAAGAYAVLTFSVGHGCDGSPTTEITISMPEEILQVTPTRNALWEVEKVDESLDEPVADAHGNEITERIAEVVYTADQPLPDGYRDAFELSLQLPQTPGETLVFPVVQTCEKGETGWTETAAEGQDPHELEYPAPVVTITEAEGDGHGAEASDEGGETDGGGETDEPEAAEVEAGGADDDGGDALTWLALAAGVGGLLVGGAALARGRKA